MIPGSSGGRGPAALVAVLAGGRARRLGGAKATAELGGRALIEHPLAAAAEAGLRAIVVARADSALPALSVPLLVEPEGPRHPVWGIAAALRSEQAGGGPVLAVGCDMPFLPAGLLGALADPDEAGDPLATSAGGRVQPLPARYGPDRAGELEAAARAGEGMAATLARLGATLLEEARISVFGEPAELLASVNDPAGLEQARRSLGRSGPG